MVHHDPHRIKCSALTQVYAAAMLAGALFALFFVEAR
jgi:hypothetical protein